MISPYELIKQADIINVVGNYIQFTNTSDPSDIRALCPFHLDSDPSFSINANKQVYYCFGCKAGGNVLTFIKDIEKISKEEAVEVLAKILGYEVKSEDNELFLKVADYYHSRIEEIADYIIKRSFQFGIVSELNLGYSGSDTFDLVKKFKGYEKSLVELGLLNQKYAGTPSEIFMSVFVNRLMFPIENQYGIVGFTGRTLIDIEPKYLNTIETKYFSRRKLLYGYQKAKKHIKELGFAYMVEGLADVGRMWTRGNLNTVSSLGTSVNEEQINLIRRITNRVKIAFDGDEAGRKASVKLTQSLISSGIESKVVRFPDKQDPDSYLVKHEDLDELNEDLDLEVITKYVTKEDFIEFVNKAKNMELIDNKYFAIYGIQKSNMLKKSTQSIKPNKLINSDPLFHLTLLLDAYPELEKHLDKELIEKVVLLKEESSVAKIIFERNPYQVMRDPVRTLKTILGEMK